VLPMKYTCLLPPDHALESNGLGILRTNDSRSRNGPPKLRQVSAMASNDQIICFSSLSYRQRLKAPPSGRKLRTRHGNVLVTQGNEQVRFP